MGTEAEVMFQLCRGGDVFMTLSVTMASIDLQVGLDLLSECSLHLLLALLDCRGPAPLPVERNISERLIEQKSCRDRDSLLRDRRQMEGGETAEEDEETEKAKMMAMCGGNPFLEEFAG